MATLDAPDAEWRHALALVRAAYDAVVAGGEDAGERIRSAHDFLSVADSDRLRGFARLLIPDGDERQLLSALVPLERVDARTRVTDSDMALTDRDCSHVEPSVFPVVVIADNIRSAFNIGGIFRSADFFGFERVVLCGYSATPEHPQVRKAALGAADYMPFESIVDVRDAVAKYRAEGRQVYALETSERAIEPHEVPLDAPAAVVVGSERFGLDPDVVAMCDSCVSIRGYGHKNSLNVVCAFSICAQALRQNWNVVQYEKAK